MLIIEMAEGEECNHKEIHDKMMIHVDEMMMVLFGGSRSGGGRGMRKERLQR